MAARRLVVLMIVLLVASTVAAALAPTADRQRERTETRSQTTTAAPRPPAGRSIRATIDPTGERIRAIRLRTGDRLRLTVSPPADGFATVRIDGTGLAGTALSGVPARFDFLAREPGRFEIVDVEEERTLGTVAVRARRPDRG